MTATIETHIQAVDATTLTPIVLRTIGCTEGELVEWRSEPIRPMQAHGVTLEDNADRVRYGE